MLANSRYFFARIFSTTSYSKHYRVFRKSSFGLIRNHYASAKLCYRAPFSTKVLPRQSLRPKDIVNVDELFRFIKKSQFYLKMLTKIFDRINFNNLGEEQVVILMECCGSSVFDSSCEQRNGVCQEIYTNALKANKVNLDVYHTYIKICTENHVLLNNNEFLKVMQCDPNEVTYRLLMQNTCEKGNVQQAVALLSVMKDNDIPADENVFNSMVFCHTLNGGLNDAESVLRTMKTAQIPETKNTRYSMLRGLSTRNNLSEFEIALQKYSLILNRDEFFTLLTTLASNNNISWLEKITPLYPYAITRDFVHSLKNVCIHLVHICKPKEAMAIYEALVEPQFDENYGFILLKEMLHCNIPIDVIINIAKDLCDKGLNQYCMEHVTFLALKHQYVEPALSLLQNLPDVRPHYFWPLLVHSKETNGEIGVINVLKKAHEMKIKLDSVTLESYVFPFCDLSNPILLLKELQNFEYTIKQLLSPLLTVLLQKKEIKVAADLCQTYNVEIFGDDFLKVLSKAWKSTNDISSAVFLLQRYYESVKLDNKNLVGDFLEKCFQNCKHVADFKKFLQLIKVVHDKRLKINVTSSERLHELLAKHHQLTDSLILSHLKDEIDNLLDFNLNPETHHIPHPKNMTLEELECHLLELQEKNMETRGVLRKLIQLHCRLGNSKRVEELREQFLSAGYEESPGMKSSLMHIYAQVGHFDEAMEFYNKIKSQNQGFKIDSFKLVDLAALLVKKNRVSEALDMLKAEKQARVSSQIQRHCRELLSTFTNEDDQMNMFNILINNQYCSANNIMLGPLIRLHLNNGDLNKAVNLFEDLAAKYKCTPLQLEILCATINNDDKTFSQRIIDSIQKVHGIMGVNIALMSALAENGLEKQLKKFLLSLRQPVKNEMEKRCRRWVEEQKLKPLETLAESCTNISPEILDGSFVYTCIVQVFSLKNDYKSALSLYRRFLEEDRYISQEFENEIVKLLKRWNITKPKSLKLELDNSL